MHALRRARHLTRLVLVWFVMAMGVAVTSPLVNPQSMELICSGSGTMKLLLKSEDGRAHIASHTLDCSLCASMGGLPPPVWSWDAGSAPPQAHEPVSIPSTRIVALSAAPLPARGPPTL